MIAFLRKHEVWLVLALIVSANALFVTCVVNGILPESLYGFGRFALLGAVLFGSVFLLRGMNGIMDILKPMFVWKLQPLLYLFAITWTACLCFLVLIAKQVITADSLTMDELVTGLQSIMSPRLLVTLLVSSFIGEMVWISYAVRKLSVRFTHFVSALIVGAVWTAWWLPMSIYDFGIIPGLPLVALLFNQMGIAAMCAFVYFHTRSGLLVLVMQIMFNATILVFPITPTIGGAPTYWAFALTYFAASLVLFLVFGPKPIIGFSKRSRVESPVSDGSKILTSSGV